jgi:hypothetical protein
MADGRAAADAAGGRRAGARRHVARRDPGHARLLVGWSLASSQGTFMPLTLISAMLGSLFFKLGTKLSF